MQNPSTSTADLDSPASPPSPPSPRLDLKRGTYWMLLSVLTYAANTLMLKYFSSSRQISPWVSLSVRFATGLLLTTFLFQKLGGIRLARCFQSWLLISRGVLGGLSTAALYLSIGPLGVGKSVLIGNTWTLFSAIFAVWLLKEKLSKARIGGIFLAIAGLCCLMGLGSGLKGLGEDLHWEIIQLVGALMAALVIVMIRQLTKSESSATIFGSQCLYGLFLALPFALSHFSTLTGMDIFLLTLSGAFAAVGQLAMTEGFRFLSVAAGGGFQIMLPLLIAIGGAVFFEEKLNTWQLLGAFGILSGSFLTIMVPAKKSPPETTPLR